MCSLHLLNLEKLHFTLDDLETLRQPAMRRCEARGPEAAMGGLNLKGEEKCD
jgi:hypothetical protein